MNGNMNFGNNDLGNGYIYQELINKISLLENQVKELMSLIETANNDMKISVKDYVSIIKELNNRVTNDEFLEHIQNNEIHHHRSTSLNYLEESGTTQPDKNK